MKAVIMEIRDTRAVLMTEGGAFEMVKNENYCVGQQVSWAEKHPIPVRRWILAASILLVLMAGTGTLAARLPFAYVSLDINPSLEYSLNWFDRVISVHAVNDDAQPIAQKLLKAGVMNQPADQAIGMALSEFLQNRYVDSDSENDVILAVASLGIKNVDGLTKRIAESAGDYGRQMPVTITTFQADSASVKRSREFKTTAGKLMLVESLGTLEGNPSDFSREEWLEKPVRDILDRKKAIREKSTADKSQKPKVVAPSTVPSAAPDAGSMPAGGIGPSSNAPSASIVPEVSPSPKGSASKPKKTKSPAGASRKKKTPSKSAPKKDNNGASGHSSQNNGDKQNSGHKS